MFADALGTRAYAAPRRENDEGGRFTNRPSGDSHRAFHPSGCAAVSCGLAARPPVAGRAAPAVAVATPLAEGSVRHSGECVFTTRRPPSRGRYSANDPCWKAVQRRFEAAEQAFAVQPSVGAAGVPAVTRFAGPAFVVQRGRAAHSSLLTLTPTFRFRTRTTGLGQIAMRKLLLLGPVPVPAQVEAQEKAGRMMREAGPSAAAATPSRDAAPASRDGSPGRRTRTAWSRPAAVPIPRAPSTASEQSVRFRRERWFVHPALRAVRHRPRPIGGQDLKRMEACSSRTPIMRVLRSASGFRGRAM